MYIIIVADIKIPAIYGAQPKTDDPLKCIIMSHGLGGCRFLYSTICCELASRGFLVVALEHRWIVTNIIFSFNITVLFLSFRDHSACTTYYYANKADAENDKRSIVEFRHIQFGKDHYDRRNEQLKTKADECDKILEFLIQLNKGVVPYNVMDDAPVHKNADIKFDLSQLVGKLDVDNLIMMGHSFGAATSLYTLSRRKEFR